MYVHQSAGALTVVEQSKARVLLDVFQAGRTNIRKSLLPQEYQTEEEQRLRLVALNSQLTGELRRKEPDRARVAELKANIERAGWSTKPSKPDSMSPTPN